MIAVVAKNGGIGLNNRLLCHLPSDLKRFRQITSGHLVIMGRNTFLSLPGGALKNRRNVVITDREDDRFGNCEMVPSLEAALELCRSADECFVIGGASVYRQFMPHAQRLYLTRLHKDFEADTYFPPVLPDEWKEVSVELPAPDETVDFQFDYALYERKI